MIHQILFVCLCFCQYLPDYFRETILITWEALICNIISFYGIRGKYFPHRIFLRLEQTLNVHRKRGRVCFQTAVESIARNIFFFRCVMARYIDWQSRLLAWYNFTISLSGRNLESVNLFKLFSAESCTELDYVKRESFFTINKESMTSECKIQFSQPWAMNCISFRLFICLSSAHETFAKHWVLVQKGLLIILLTAFIWNDPHRVKGVKLSRSIAFVCITRSKMAWFLARKKKNIYWDCTVVWFLPFHAAFTKNKGTLLS